MVVEASKILVASYRTKNAGHPHAGSADGEYFNFEGPMGHARLVKETCIYVGVGTKYKHAVTGHTMHLPRLNSVIKNEGKFPTRT